LQFIYWSLPIPYDSIDNYNRSHYTYMMTWFDTYNEYIKNFEKIIQLQQDYIRNLERISHLYNEFIKNIERVNEIYNEFIVSYKKLSSLYEQQFQNMQRMNQRWLNLFSKPWEQNQSEKYKDWDHLLTLSSRKRLYYLLLLLEPIVRKRVIRYFEELHFLSISDMMRWMMIILYRIWKNLP